MQTTGQVGRGISIPARLRVLDSYSHEVTNLSDHQNNLIRAYMNQVAQMVHNGLPNMQSFSYPLPGGRVTITYRFGEYDVDVVVYPTRPVERVVEHGEGEFFFFLRMVDFSKETCNGRVSEDVRETAVDLEDFSKKQVHLPNVLNYYSTDYSTTYTSPPYATPVYVYQYSGGELLDNNLGACLFRDNGVFKQYPSKVRVGSAGVNSNGVFVEFLFVHINYGQYFIQVRAGNNIFYFPGVYYLLTGDSFKFESNGDVSQAITSDKLFSIDYENRTVTELPTGENKPVGFKRNDEVWYDKEFFDISEDVQSDLQYGYWQDVSDLPESGSAGQVGSATYATYVDSSGQSVYTLTLLVEGAAVETIVTVNTPNPPPSLTTITLPWQCVDPTGYGLFALVDTPNFIKPDELWIESQYNLLAAEIRTYFAHPNHRILLYGVLEESYQGAWESNFFGDLESRPVYWTRTHVLKYYAWVRGVKYELQAFQFNKVEAYLAPLNESGYRYYATHHAFNKDGDGLVAFVFQKADVDNGSFNPEGWLYKYVLMSLHHGRVRFEYSSDVAYGEIPAMVFHHSLK